MAAGAPLGCARADVVPRGHAIEARLYAEDPAASFFPSAGPILALREQNGPGIRVDSGVTTGSVVPLEYDPLLGKISAWGSDRSSAIARLGAALRDTAVLRPTTHPALPPGVPPPAPVPRGETHTGFPARPLPACGGRADDARRP